MKIFATVSAGIALVAAQEANTTTAVPEYKDSPV